MALIMWIGKIHPRFTEAEAGQGGWRLVRNAGETAGCRGWSMGNERSGLLAVALATAIAMPLAPRLAWPQDQSLIQAQQSQAPAATQSAAPQSSQDNATQADGNCPGHPGALGTSRVLALDPAQYPRVGHMQYPDTLPLNDKEVVLTFDDARCRPIPTRFSTSSLRNA